MIKTSPLVKTYTLQEFWDLAQPPDRSKLELIKGVLYMLPPPGELHDDIAAIVNDLLIAARSGKTDIAGGSSYLVLRFGRITTRIWSPISCTSRMN